LGDFRQFGTVAVPAGNWSPVGQQHRQAEQPGLTRRLIARQVGAQRFELGLRAVTWVSSPRPASRKRWISVVLCDCRSRECWAISRSSLAAHTWV
jgi:hypothetical protein